MNSTSHSSESSKILHSTPKSMRMGQSQDQSRCSSTGLSVGTRQSEQRKSTEKDYTYSTSTVTSPMTSCSQHTKESAKLDSGHSGSVSRVLEETGDSTRSLLSVLSHSSVESLSSGTISHSSPETSLSKKDKISAGETSHSVDNYSKDKSLSKSDKETDLTHWEKWLLQKSQEERQKVHDEVRLKLVELKAKEKEDEKLVERRTHIERQVVVWLKEKERFEKKKANREARQKKIEQKKKHEEKQRISEREKIDRENWLSKKREKEKLERDNEAIEKQKGVKEEQERKGKAEEAFKKWKRESKFKTRPPTGHVGNSSYPVPGYCNPNPWMPIHAPSSTQVTTDSGKRKKKGGNKAKKQAFQSPPLLFKDQTNKSIANVWGRPR